jgi:hypothetical protein
MVIPVEVGIAVSPPVPSPRRGEGIGGLWPPFFAPRTPMRSIGYGEGVPGFDCFIGREPPHPNPLPAGERERTVRVARWCVPIRRKPA